MLFQWNFSKFLFISGAVLLALTSLSVPPASATGTHFDLTFDNNGRLATDFGGEDRGRGVCLQSDSKIVAVGYVGGGANLIALSRYNSDGSLDTSFSGDGKVTFAMNGGVLFSCAIQTDGKIVAVGSWRNPSANQDSEGLLVRFNTNGSIDATFGTDGVVKSNIGGVGSHGNFSDVGIQTNGRIVVSGVVVNQPAAANFAALRYNTDGTPDSAFGTGGVVITDLGSNDFDQSYALAITSAGKIVVGGIGATGDNDFGLVRYNSNGTLDSTFGTGGIVRTDFNGGADAISDLTIQPDGKIVAVGSATPFNKTIFAAARYNTNGTLDTSFDGDGKATTDVTFLLESRAVAVALQADGKIVSAGINDTSGQIDGDFTLVRYNPNGTLDAAFGRAGILRSDLNNGSDDEAWGIGIYPNGNLLVIGDTLNSAGGSTVNFGLARYKPNMNARFDFDGDGYGDMSVVRGPNFNTWYLLKSSSGSFSTTFGLPTDRLTPADYDGDGLTDIGIYRPSTGTWYWIRSSSNSFTSTQFGVQEDLPTPADYDGDGRADLSVYRPSAGTWYRLNSNNGTFAFVAFGASNDKPTIGDFDGDGRADIATFRPSTGTWYRLNSSDNAFVQTQFGLSTDLIVPGDYDGDGKTDLTVYRVSSNTWYRLSSSDGTLVSSQFGTAGDVPAVTDYDRDGKDDLSLFRQSTGVWYRINSSFNSFVGQHYGTAGDVPLPAAFNY